MATKAPGPPSNEESAQKEDLDELRRRVEELAAEFSRSNRLFINGRPGSVQVEARSPEDAGRHLYPEALEVPLRLAAGPDILPSIEEAAPGAEAAATRSKRSTPAGKVKASFNLLPGDIDSLRAMAGWLKTTVTNVVQRAIRDERFIQEQLAQGNRFAVVDREGTAREIIWR